MTRPMAVDVLATRPSDKIKARGAGGFRASAGLGELAFQGWAVVPSSMPVGIALRGPDDTLIARAPIGAARPDIARLFPAVGGAERCGFHVHLTPLGPGTCSLFVYVTLRDESELALGSVDVRVGSTDSDESVSWSITAVDGESAKVLRGRDGWLFLREDSNDVLGQHTGRVTFAEEDREAWRRLLEARIATTTELGVEWQCEIVPDKESLYPEHLPAGIVPVRRRPVHDFLDIAKSVGAPATYLLDDLVAEKSRAELYSRNDTHWNHRGAFIAYRHLCRRLLRRGVKIDPLDENALTWISEPETGDLGEKCYPAPVSSPTIKVRIEEERAVLRYDNEVRSHGRVVIFERPADHPAATCVVFGESFVDNLLLFLRETFRRLVFVHTSMLVEEIVRQERPDVVLTVPVERFLLKVPDDRDGFERLARTASEKGGSLPWSAAR